MFVQELYGVFTAASLRYSMFLQRGVMWNGFSVGRVQYCGAIYCCDGAAGDVCLVVGWLLLWLCQGIYGRHRPRQILHRIVLYHIVSDPHVYCVLIVSLEPSFLFNCHIFADVLS